MDQIIFRDSFKSLKATLDFKVFFKQDSHDIYLYGNHLIKLEYPLNEQSILNATNKINTIQKTYLNGMNCYYAIVPDKNYFTNKEKYICMDYEKLQNILAQNLSDMQYINIFDTLQLEDYYITDIHWKQEKLSKVAYTIADNMHFRDKLTTPYTLHNIMQFDGLYASSLPIKTQKDYISVLTNTVIENASVYNYETKLQTKVYDLSKVNSNDKYDIYLSGPTPLITINNPNATTTKELIIFRDSFGSSLAPLFIEAYAKITLVDIRYMKSSDLGQYIHFSDQDILFLYSTLVLNNSTTLK